MVAGWVATLSSTTTSLTVAFFVFPFLLLSSAGKAYAPEFYYDTYNPLWQNRPRVYSYSLQWTQMNPSAVDRILAYRLGIRQVRREAPSCRRCPLVCWPLPGLPGLMLFVLFFFLCVISLHFTLCCLFTSLLPCSVNRSGLCSFQKVCCHLADVVLCCVQILEANLHISSMKRGD